MTQGGAIVSHGIVTVKDHVRDVRLSSQDFMPKEIASVEAIIKQDSDESANFIFA